MEQILDYIVNNYDIIIGTVAIVVSLLTVGRKRAIEMVLKHLDLAKEDLLRDIDRKAHSYAKYIYTKLPRTAKVFMSVGSIEKMIIKFANEVKDLDKKAK
jgi:hypothetical protein